MVIDLIVAIICIVLISSASYFIISQKRRGSKCIGCTMSHKCQPTTECREDVVNFYKRVKDE